MGVVGCAENDTVPCARPSTAPAINKPTARTPVTARLPQFRAPVVLTSPIVFNRNIRLHVSSSVQPLPASNLFQRLLNISFTNQDITSSPHLPCPQHRIYQRIAIVRQ